MGIYQSIYLFSFEVSKRLWSVLTQSNEQFSRNGWEDCLKNWGFCFMRSWDWWCMPFWLVNRSRAAWDSIWQSISCQSVGYSGRCNHKAKVSLALSLLLSLWYPSPFLFDPQSFELINSLLPRVSTDNHQLCYTFKLNTPCVKLVRKVHTSFLASEVCYLKTDEYSFWGISWVCSSCEAFIHSNVVLWCLSHQAVLRAKKSPILTDDIVLCIVFCGCGVTAHFFMHWFLKHVELVGMLTMSERVAVSFHHLRQVLFQLAEKPSDEFPFWNLNQPPMHGHL